jgi:hypothetical protein
MFLTLLPAKLHGLKGEICELQRTAKRDPTPAASPEKGEDF